MAQAPIELRRKLDADTLRRAASAREEDFVVFLAGPFIDPEDESLSTNIPSGALRFGLFHRLRAAECTVSLGEYKELINAQREALGAYHNAAIAELSHARELAHAVVIIVDSPGSFAELGAFSMKEDICEKMLIISDITHQNSTGYVATGPVIQAGVLGAQVEYLDLADHDAADRVVSAFVTKIKQRRLMRHMLTA